jgi:hypothetical protein
MEIEVLEEGVQDSGMVSACCSAGTSSARA